MFILTSTTNRCSFGLLRLLLTCPKPLIAAVNGRTAGFGLSVVALSDIVFASEKVMYWVSKIIHPSWSDFICVFKCLISELYLIWKIVIVSKEFFAHTVTSLTFKSFLRVLWKKERNWYNFENSQTFFNIICQTFIESFLIGQFTSPMNAINTSIIHSDENPQSEKVYLVTGRY